jgi:PAS domain S-box-containing protein
MTMTMSAPMPRHRCDSEFARRQDLNIRVTTGPSALPGDPEVFLKTILRSVTDYAIVTLDRNGLVTSWNEGAHLILGWSSDEMLGVPASRFFTAKDNQGGVLRGEIDDALAEGHGAVERWHVRKVGSTFWASGEMMPLTDADGRVAGFVKILRDRTRERAASEKQRKEAEFLRSIHAASRDGISILALDGALTTEDAGRQARQGNEIPSVRADWSADVVTAFETARSGGTGHFETTTHASDRDTTRYWDVAVTPILGLDGKPERLLAVSREISDLRRAEQRQHLLMQELAHRV